MAVGAGDVCHHDAMSDDDLWRRQEPTAPDEASTADPGERAHQPTPAPTPPPAAPGGSVSDETQPLTGPGSAPGPYSPPSAPGVAPGAGPGAVPPPYNPYDPAGPYAGSQAPPTAPMGQPGPYGGQGFTPPPNPYPAPHEYAIPQSPYGGPYQPAYAGGQLAEHPSANTAMVLGIVGLASIVVCAGVLLVLSPAAWVVGARAVREIDAAPGRYSGRDKAQAGRVMGIIGSILLVLGVLAIIAFVVLAVAIGSSDSGTVPTYGNGGA
jgi:hypothetical protein